MIQKTNLGLDINSIDDDIRTIKRNADVLVNVYKDFGLAVNTEKTKYIEVERH